MGNPGFLRWLDWNIFGTPIIWGIFILLHAARVFEWSPFFNKKWEQRQIEKYMSNEE